MTENKIKKLPDIVFNLIHISPQVRLIVSFAIAFLLVGLVSMYLRPAAFKETHAFNAELDEHHFNFKQQFSTPPVAANLSNQLQVTLKNSSKQPIQLHFYANVITRLEGATAVMATGEPLKVRFEKTCLDWFIGDASAFTITLPPDQTTRLTIKASSQIQSALRVIAVDETAFQRMQLTTGLTVGGLALLLILSVVFSAEILRLLGQSVGWLLVLSTLLHVLTCLLFLTDDNFSDLFLISSLLCSLFLILEYVTSALTLRLVSPTTPRKFIKTGYIAIVALPSTYLLLILLFPSYTRGLALGFILGAVLYRLWGLLRQSLVSPDGNSILLGDIINIVQWVCLFAFLHGLTDSGPLFLATIANILARLVTVKLLYTKRLMRTLKSQQMQESLQSLRIRRGGEQKLMDTRESLSGFLHDIRQPLSAINFTAQAQIRLAQMANRDDALWQRILAAQKSVDEILDSLIGRIRSNLKQSTSFELKEISLHDLVSPIADEYRELIRQRDLTIHFYASEYSVLVDVVAVRRTIRNAVDNAFKHCRTGKILIGCRRTANGALIQVWDTGPGFSSYAQNLPTTGTHTGNKVVFDLVRSIGGQMDIKNVTYRHGQYKTGARFELRFPKTPQNSHVHKHDSHFGKLINNRYQGLIIDIEPDNFTVNLQEKLRLEMCDTVLSNKQKTIFQMLDDQIYPVFVVVIVRHKQMGVEHILRDGIRHHGASTVPFLYINPNDVELKGAEWDQETVIGKAFNEPEFILRTIRVQTGLSKEMFDEGHVITV